MSEINEPLLLLVEAIRIAEWGVCVWEGGSVGQRW